MKWWPDLEALRNASEPVSSMMSAGNLYQNDLKFMQHVEIGNLLTVLQWLWELVEELSRKKAPHPKWDVEIFRTVIASPALTGHFLIFKNSQMKQALIENI